MEAAVNHTIFKQTFSKVPLSRSAIHESAKSVAISYTDTMLCEYLQLVNSLNKLNPLHIKWLEEEINSVLDSLISWQKKESTLNTAELFYSLLQLKQKANNLSILNSQKTSMINSRVNTQIFSDANVIV